MSLPSIAPYALPRAHELPASRPDWSPDPARAVLLVHDMQRYFLAPFSRTDEPVSRVIENIATLTTRARELDVPVVYTAQPGVQPPAERGLLDDFWGRGPAAAYTEDPDVVAIVDELTPAPGDEVLTKWRYSAFQRSPLEQMLADRGRDQLVITGIYAHIGCMVTAVDAFMRDVQPFLVADAVADFSRDHHEQALTWTAQRAGVVLATTDALRALDAADPAAPAAVREAPA
ncbi:isochorismatase family protein [Actinomycetospora lemnae]|uniref:Isochorismatase family protein n=1 Tax=Actinomycetospora lemnae TaxID=3019891 RepID=A0ABT5T4W8_9PSEU|nr:isochorismatase family protein [Actinomycetospora sp. DW7H6]MDD7969421.1 isochorismatase family protein [Actinomycetospora sp. DW7H6]